MLKIVEDEVSEESARSHSSADQDGLFHIARLKKTWHLSRFISAGSMYSVTRTRHELHVKC